MLRKTKWSSISLAQLLKGRHIGCNSPDGPWKSCQTYSDVVGMSTIRGNTMSSASMALWELKQSKMRYSLVDVLLSYAATDLSQKKGLCRSSKRLPGVLVLVPWKALMEQFLPMVKLAQERHSLSQEVRKDMWTVVSFQGPYHWCLVNWQSAVIISTWYNRFLLGASLCPSTLLLIQSACKLSFFVYANRLWSSAC